MIKNKTLFLIGLYLVGDGIISYLYFKDTATTMQQVIRVIRTIIGAYIMTKGGD